MENALAIQSLFTSSQGTPSSQVGNIGSWKTPEHGFLKLNVDGALFVDFQVASIGAIIWDSHSEVVLAASMKENDILDPETIENLVVMRRLQLNMHLGVTQLLIESNCQSVVKEIQGNKESSSTLGNLIHDIKELMARFQCCTIQFNHRHCNTAAHRLAR